MKHRFGPVLFLLSLCLVADIARGLTYATLNDAFDSKPGVAYNLQTSDGKVGLFSGDFVAANQSWVDMTAPNVWSFTGRNFTFDFWINLTAAPASEQAIVWMDNEVAIILLSPGILQFIIVSGAPCTGRSIQTGTLQPNVWYHLTMTGGDDVSIIPYLSVNGTIVQQSSIFVSPLCTSSTNTTIARHPTLTTRFLNAKLDDMRVWGRTLSNSETYSFHNNGTVPSTSGLKAYYDFEGNFTASAPTVPVLSGVFVPCGTFALNWTESGGFPAPAAYEVSRSSPAGGNWSFLVPPNGNFTLRLFNDTFPQVNATFSYVVRANNTVGWSAYSNVVMFTPPEIVTIGDCGLQWGGFSQEELADLAHITPASLDILFSIIWILIGAGIGFLITGGGGGTSFGAAVGVVFSIALDLIPEWAIMFVVILFAAAYFARREGTDAVRRFRRG